MKYQVILNNTQVLSTHKSRELAERAMKRAMKKQALEDDAHNRMIGWVDSKLVRRTSGIYHIRAV
jgi:hypothetical protein